MSDDAYACISVEGGVAVWTGPPDRPTLVGWWSTPDAAARWVQRRGQAALRWHAPTHGHLTRAQATVFCGTLDGGVVVAWRGDAAQPQWVADTAQRPLRFTSWRGAAQRLLAAGAPPRFYVPPAVVEAARRPPVDPDGEPPGALWYIAPALAGDPAGWWAWQPLLRQPGQIRLARDAQAPFDVLVFPTLGELAAWVRAQHGRPGGYLPAATRLAFVRAYAPQADQRAAVAR
jgi:hypothetical protein